MPNGYHLNPGDISACQRTYAWADPPSPTVRLTERQHAHQINTTMANMREYADLPCLKCERRSQCAIDGFECGEYRKYVRLPVQGRKTPT